MRAGLFLCRFLRGLSFGAVADDEVIDGEFTDLELFHVAAFQLESADSELANGEGADGNGSEGNGSYSGGADGQDTCSDTGFDEGCGTRAEVHAGIVDRAG